MRSIALAILIALPAGLPAAAQVDPAAPKEAVTLEIDADLLRRARAMNVDLSFVMEKQLEAVLGAVAVPAAAPPAAAVSHQSVITAAFDNFEAMVFAPLKINSSTPVAGVRAACQAVLDGLDQLVAHAETRKSLPLPASLEEAQKLDQYLAGRRQAFGARMGKDGNKIEASSKIMEANCPDLNADEAAAQQAMTTALGDYGPVGWCRATMRKPQAQWTMEIATNFAKYCQGVKLN